MSETPVRVLIVEDSEDDALLLAHELRRAAGTVQTRRVESADEMRAALHDGDWDLVVSDHAMPRFSSLEAYQLLRASGRDIPFIIYSGNIADDDAEAAMADGVHDFVQKGNLRRLLPVLRREFKTVSEAKARAQAEELLDRITNYDPLTGLPSRELFDRRAREILREKKSMGGCAVLAFADLDRFMRINNTFGYDLGDALLREVGARLQEAAGTRALVTHMGRDEFALLDPGAAPTDAAPGLSDRIMRAFEQPFRIEGQELYITLSLGTCRFPDDGDDLGALMVNAENAMALAKRNGRNNCQPYVRALNEASAERLRLETGLRHALANDELLLHYQPIVALEGGEVVGVEALVRWRHPTLGMIPPDRFIPIADETGLIAELGRWVLGEACAQTRRWHDAGFPGLRISVNVSAVQFRQPGFIDTVREVLVRTGLPPQCLDLEITETVLMQDVDATVAGLRELKAMGVRISVDDFGTGYSSLAYLKRFPIDTLKIDKSFVRDVTSDEHNAAIVRTIITLARSLALESIAEGVEQEDEVDFLMREGCDRLQGYCFSRPLEPARLEALLAARSRLGGGKGMDS